MPAETALKQELTEQLIQNRYLTEVHHLLARRQGVGVYDTDGLQDVETNLYTATAETAIPGLVTTTFQRAAEMEDLEGRKRRLFMWLGKCAVEVAESGRRYHFSNAALERVDIEIAEARHSQERLRPGFAQVFISPKMSAYDAPPEVAEKEHLAADDSVRVSFLETDRHGKLLGRRMESLLVLDIPLAAWVAMLKDPANIFGQAFEMRNEASAQSVMELFEELELPVDIVGNGPVTIVEAVLPYIRDQASHDSVRHQLAKFHADQTRNRATAERTAQEWLKFEIELAESLATGVATYEPTRFIVSLQQQWGDTELTIIANHLRPDGQYTMTRELAALLEKAKQNILIARAAVVTRNEKVTDQMSAHTTQDIYAREQEIQSMKANGGPAHEIARKQAELDRRVAGQNLSVGGGCPGENAGSFRDSDDPSNDKPDTADSKENWKWKSGTCIIRNCISPKPTEVGPCSVCRNCQCEFDAGRDPTKVSGKETIASKRDPLEGLFKDLRSFLKQESAKRDPHKKAATKHSGELAVAGASS